MKNSNSLNGSWLKLSIMALALSGFYSIFIVLLRTPFLTNFFSDKSIFYKALIIHVDLSVLFWLVSFVLMEITSRFSNKFYLGVIAWVIRILYLSLFMIFISSLVPDSEAFMNNYVPILHNIIFIIGLGLFFASFFVICLISLLDQENNIKPVGLLGVLFFVSLGISIYKISFIGYEISQHYLYEILFWGAGHVLQFFYCAGLIIVFFYFSNSKNQAIPLDFFLWLNTLIVIPAIIAQCFINIDDQYYIDLFTQHMKICGGIAPVTALISIFLSGFNDGSKKNLNFDRNNKIVSISFFFCLFMFGFGGLIGLLISEVNVTIPAHYHGSIVGITIGFMGYIYLKVDDIFSNINIKLAKWQIIIYSLGQLVHISALAYSGGYGAMRKTPGVELAIEAKVAMGFMGLGGLLAIVGGLLFVYICVMSIIKSLPKNKQLYEKTF